MHWITEFRRITERKPCVLVTLILISGSAPRESGCRMIVAGDEVAGSIGGGNLEFQATAMARELLEQADHGSQVKKLYGLGPELNQCCGGAVALYYEVYSGDPPDWLEALEVAIENSEEALLISALDRPESFKALVRLSRTLNDSIPSAVLEFARKFLGGNSAQQKSSGVVVETEEGDWWVEPVGRGLQPVMLFGAGHVGNALASALSPLPFEVTWLDSRDGVFPETSGINIQPVQTMDPAQWVGRAGPGTIFIVMTHSHQLDEDICFEILQRNDFGWLGLIGSETKRRRFVHRLEKRGVPVSRMDRLVCPIGLAGIRGKQPATIALSVAAQLMTHLSERTWILEKN